MIAVQVTISSFTNESFPGWVECWLEDAHGRWWKFNEKVPGASTEALWTESEYPKPGAIACTVLRRTADGSRRHVVTIDTEGVETVEGCAVFEVLAEQLEGDTVPN